MDHCHKQKRAVELNILFLEPYFGGSHKSFIDGWEGHSQHDFTVLSLPPYKWRWRMRHSAVTFAQQVGDEFERGKEFDLIICSGMLDVATFLGLAPAQARSVPFVLYMHENQLTYPVPEGVKRDSDAVFKQLTSCLAATEIWWNSAYNMNSFLEALPKYLKRMPDFKMLDSVEKIRDKSRVTALGIDTSLINEINLKPQTSNLKPELTIIWAARWEHDKNPEDFFAALSILKSKGVEFKLNVIGEQFRTYPAVFDSAEREFENEIINWGYLQTRGDYIKVLCSSDLIVSTAIHEFFGISILEGVSAGAYPVLPNRLAYPEIFADDDESFFYGDNAEDLAQKLTELAERHQTTGSVWINGKNAAREIAMRYKWSTIATNLDNRITELTTND